MNCIKIQEVLAMANRLLFYHMDGPHRKRLLKQFFYIFVCIRFQKCQQVKHHLRHLGVEGAICTEVNSVRIRSSPGLS
jgi:hypothetical protein